MKNNYNNNQENMGTFFKKSPFYNKRPDINLCI